MKSLLILALFILVQSSWSLLELELLPPMNSVVEGGEYEVIVRVLSGMAEEEMFFVVKASYRFGSAERLASIIIPNGEGPGFETTAVFMSVSNEALDPGNTIFLELCAVDDLENPLDRAEVRVTDDDIVFIGFEFPEYEVLPGNSFVYVCLVIADASEAIRRPIDFRIDSDANCASFIDQFRIGSEPGSRACFYKPIEGMMEEPNSTLTIRAEVQDLNVLFVDGRQEASVLQGDDCQLQFIDNTPEVTDNELRVSIPGPCLAGAKCFIMRSRSDDEFPCNETASIDSVNRLTVVVRREGSELQREFRRDNRQCDVHLVNGMGPGVVINPDNSASIRFEGTGISDDLTFKCRLDNMDFMDCEESGFTTMPNLSPGQHTITIAPSGSNCRRNNRRAVGFTIAP